MVMLLLISLPIHSPVSLTLAHYSLTHKVNLKSGAASNRERGERTTTSEMERGKEDYYCSGIGQLDSTADGGAGIQPTDDRRPSASAERTPQIYRVTRQVGNYILLTLIGYLAAMAWHVGKQRGGTPKSKSTKYSQ